SAEFAATFPCLAGGLMDACAGRGGRVLGEPTLSQAIERVGGETLFQRAGDPLPVATWKIELDPVMGHAQALACASDAELLALALLFVRSSAGVRTELLELLSQRDRAALALGAGRLRRQLEQEVG